MLRIASGRWATIALITALGACSSEESGDEDGEQKNASVSGADEDEDNEESTPAKKDSGASSAKKDSGPPMKADAGGARDAGAGESPSAGGELPCEIAKIIETNCADCHGASPAGGATFSLASLADFQAPGSSDESKKMHQLAQTRVTATDIKKRMPPASKDALSEADLKTLSDWLKGGAKGGAACTGGSSGGKDAGVEPTKGGSGGAHATEVIYDDPDLECHKLTAFARGGSASQPYTVPTTPDLYVAFNLKAPWQGVKYARSFRTIIDNAPVLHHWLIFKQPTGGSPSVTENAVGAHPEGQMLYGWAPGGDDLYFDPDVGMEMDSSVLYQLEMHYNNRTGGPVPDASGVEVCVTPNKPAHVAGLSWVGTDAIVGSTEAVGLCAHESSEPIHLIAAQPHMHLKGKHMKVELTRASGASEVIHDKPFDFEYQRSYIMDTVIQPGDMLTTTCSYSEPAVFGKGTNDEMCYFFSIHWPAGALSSLGLGTAIHGANSCIAL